MPRTSPCQPLQRIFPVHNLCTWLPSQQSTCQTDIVSSSYRPARSTDRLCSQCTQQHQLYRYWSTHQRHRWYTSLSRASPHTSLIRMLCILQTLWCHLPWSNICQLRMGRTPQRQYWTSLHPHREYMSFHLPHFGTCLVSTDDT